MLLAAVLYFFLVKPANHFRLTGGEEKTDLAEINVQQNARIIELLEKLTSAPKPSPDVPTEKVAPVL